MKAENSYGERQECENKDWGYYAHLSIYNFGLGYLKNLDCLEIGCGTGYGTNLLQEGGVKSILAIDKSEKEITMLKKRYPKIDFLARDLDLEGLQLGSIRVDAVFSSNVFEHLAYPEKTLEGIHASLRERGIFILAIPPVTTKGMLEMNAKNLFHINNIPPWAWMTKLNRYFEEVTYYRHWVKNNKITNSGEINRDSPSILDFVFTQEKSKIISDVWSNKTITSVFICRSPKAFIEQPSESEECPVEWHAKKTEADARQNALIELKIKLSDLVEWADKNRRENVDKSFILDGITRQIKYYLQ